MQKYFDRIFREYYQALSYFAYTYLQDKVLAEDAVQNVFIKFWDSDSVFEDELHLKNVLYKMVRNACLNELKSVSIRSDILRQIEEESEVADTDFFDAVVRTEVSLFFSVY